MFLVLKDPAAGWGALAASRISVSALFTRMILPASLVSALADRALPDKAAWFGEISLAGEIRPVAHAPLRLREAAKLGFARWYGPAGAATGGGGADYRGLAALANVVDQVMGSA